MLLHHRDNGFAEAFDFGGSNAWNGFEFGECRRLERGDAFDDIIGVDHVFFPTQAARLTGSVVC